MEIIFLFGMVQAFFLSLLIFSKKSKSTGDFILGFWLIFIGLHLLDSYFHTRLIVLKYPHLIALGYNFPILHGPFMYVYVLVMISKTDRFKLRYLLHSIPFVIASLYFIVIFYFLSASEKVIFINEKMARFGLDFKIIWIFKVFLGPLYVVFSLVKLRKHTKNISEQFSYSEKINLNWLKYIIAALGFVWLIVLITQFIRIRFPEVKIILGDNIIYLALTISVFFLGFFGFKQRVIYANEPIDSKNIDEMKQNHIEKAFIEKPKERYKRSSLDENAAKVYLNELLEFMDKKKPYLNGKLSIKEVADALDISVNHLSQVINSQTGMSFFDFVNKYRVEEMKLRLSDPKNSQFTLLAIAFDCGFNSKSSFNSIFKKNTGFSPSEFLKTLNS